MNPAPPVIRTVSSPAIRADYVMRRVGPVIGERSQDPGMTPFALPNSRVGFTLIPRTTRYAPYLVASPFARAVDTLRVDSAKGGKTETHLDGIRGMAVLFIFIRHAWGLSGQSAMVIRIPPASGTTRWPPSST